MWLLSCLALAITYHLLISSLAEMRASSIQPLGARTNIYHVQHLGRWLREGVFYLHLAFDKPEGK